MNAHLLIDYYNLPQKLLNAGVESILKQLESMIDATSTDTEDMFVRLYGGWYTDRGLSRDGTVLSQGISRTFPLVSKLPAGVRRIHCEIASSLIRLRGELFVATVREARGFERLMRSLNPQHCTLKPSCTIQGVVHWSRGGCPEPGCPVLAHEAFITQQQKLVDILIACDLLALAEAGNASRVLLVSEDDDFIPALLQARSLGADVWHVRTKLGKRRLYDSVLNRQGIRIVTL